MDLASLLTLVLILGLIGFIVYLITTYIPMPAPFPQVIIVVVVVVILLYLIGILANHSLLSSSMRR